jgi:hypothetical protein
MKCVSDLLPMVDKVDGWMIDDWCVAGIRKEAVSA